MDVETSVDVKIRFVFARACLRIPCVRVSVCLCVYLTVSLCACVFAGVHACVSACLCAA